MLRARNLSLSLGLALAAPALVACGDDGNPSTPDAPKAVDAKQTDAPDGGGDDFKGYDADEGGEIRIEYVRFANNNAALRVAAHLFKNPGSKKFFPFANLNGCTDTSNDDVYPTGQNPVEEREYLDAGQVIISGGGPETLVLDQRTTSFTDAPGRVHPANEAYFHFLGGPNPMADPPFPGGNDAALYVKEKEYVDVIFTGSNEMPAQAFDDVGWMPADFAVMEPGVEAVTLTPGQAMSFKYSTPPQNEPADFEVTSLIAFTGPQGPAVLCIEPPDGQWDVPAAMVDVALAKYPSGGTLARQTFTHEVRELVDSDGPTGKRIDFVTVWCYATRFNPPTTP